ncbi:hypothetical protein PR048_023746 [Dryococelus australis]|uniref:DUF7869 domain-containing protein n=1 Tax=Dryococelus australis TaxID=614101 RepID=A0ABQ9GV50_9NEOP|nr:hypothetical protein PR048_023746 [Dryococelus australis]
MELTCSEYWDMEMAMGASGGQTPCMLSAYNMQKTWATNSIDTYFPDFIYCTASIGGHHAATISAIPTHIRRFLTFWSDIGQPHSTMTSTETRRPEMKGPFSSVRVLGPYKRYIVQYSAEFSTSGKSPKDQRGKHHNRPMNHSMHVYSLRDNRGQKYLPESLTISKMHEMFLNTYHVTVPYKRGKGLKQKNKVHLLKAEAFRKKKKIFRRQGQAGNIGETVFQCSHIMKEIEGKGSNGVTSMMLTHINSNKNLWITFDNCCGQNKNQTMVHFLFTFVHCFHVFKTVTYLFSVRGHSHLPNDQDFSHLLTKGNDTLNLSNYQKEVRKKPSLFSVVNMHYHDFVNTKADTDDYFLNLPKPPLKIKSARMLYITEKDFDARVRDTSWTMADMHSSEETYASSIRFTILVCNTSPNCTSEEERSSTADAIYETRK